MISAPGLIAATEASKLLFVWEKATLEAKVIIVVLMFFSVFAWSVMAAKATQMRRAKRLNRLFEAEFRGQKQALDIFDRRVQVEGCPLFTVYQEGCLEMNGRLRDSAGGRRQFISLKGMEQVKTALERAVAQESLKLESGLISLALAVSGAPFLGLLGTVWGVMSAFSYVAMRGHADLATMA